MFLRIARMRIARIIWAWWVALVLAGCVLFRRVVGWRLAGVWLVFGCCRKGLGPRIRPAGAQAPAALAGWCRWWLFVWGPRKHDGKRLQCHSALDVALPCCASYGNVTHGRSR